MVKQDMSDRWCSRGVTNF